MLWGGRWEGGSCLGTHVRIKDFKILKIKKNKKIKKKKRNENKTKQTKKKMSQLFTSGGQSIGGSASTSVPLMNTQD